ncbi:MAG: DegV family protein [Anaerolineae bacterium]
MKKLVVATDSTSNLPPEIVSEYNLPVIPLKVHWGEETYIDGVTLDPGTFYRWLREREDFPTTSQPSAGEFIEFFKAISEEHDTDTIVCVVISSDLSGTYLSANQAKAALPDLNIELVDSRSVSVGLGFQALAAAEAAREGATLEEVLAQIHRVRARSSVLFTVDTLEYLHRGGRIGGAARLFGTALNLKPLLTIEGGRVDVLEKNRGRRRALQRLLQIAEERLAGRQPSCVAVIDVDASKSADIIFDEVKERLDPELLFRAVISPVVGGHAGPGTVGLGFYL